MKVLYLRKMGCDLKAPAPILNNYRVRVIENIDILYNGEALNVFFEFCHGAFWHYRTENLRTGAPLKKPVYIFDLEHGLWLDTQYEVLKGTWPDGAPYYASYRHSILEKEFHNERLEYSEASILEVVNRYKIGEKFTTILFIDEAAAAIVNRIGGFREKDIISNGCYFSVGDTWNDSHKVVRITSKAGGNSCEVDLVTGSICG